MTKDTPQARWEEEQRQERRKNFEEHALFLKEITGVSVDQRIVDYCFNKGFPIEYMTFVFFMSKQYRHPHP